MHCSVDLKNQDSVKLDPFKLCEGGTDVTSLEDK